MSNIRMRQMIATLLIWKIFLDMPITVYATNPCCSYPCENRGICTSIGERDQYECDCTGTGYFGKNCHRATWGTFIRSFYALSAETKLNIVTGYSLMWFIINSIGYLHRKATAYVYLTRGETIITPHTYNINHDYITLDVFYNRSYYARDLPPVPCNCPTAMGTKGPVELPSVDIIVEKVFRRKKFKPDIYGTNLIFVGYAQHFIHQFFKTDYERGDGFTYGDEGVDVSQIYGDDEPIRKALRSFVDGKLKTRILNGEEFPPLLEDAPEAKIFMPKVTKCYFIIPACDIHIWYPNPDPDPKLIKRVKAATQWVYGHPVFSRSPLTFVLATIWIREHNRVCTVLRKKYCRWEDERIYQTARLIVLGEMLTITMSEYVQQLAQYKIRLSYQPDLTHDINFQYSNRIRHEFNHLYHWHQLMPENIVVKNNTYKIEDLVYSGYPEILEDGIDNWIEAMTNTIAGQLTFRNIGPIMEPVSRQVIQEGRSIRLQSFNNYRKRFGLKPYKSFEDLTGEKEIAHLLKEFYHHVDAVEFFVGLVCEKHFRSVTPPSMIAMGGPWAIKGIMANPIGTPYWWKPSTFGGAEGFEMVKSATLKSLFCNNMKSKCKNFKIAYRVPAEILEQVHPVVYDDSLNK